MAPLQRNLTVRSNEDLSHSIRWLSPERSPYPLSTGKMQIRSWKDSSSPLLLEATVLNGRLTLTGAPGHWAVIVIPQASIDAVVWPVDPPYFDIFLVRASDNRRRVVMAGRILHEEGITL